MSSKLEAFLEQADFKLEGILTSDNKKIDSYFVNYINGSIYQFYNNSNDAGQNYEHILILFLTEEDRFLKEIREVRKIKMIENGKNFDREDVTKTTELDDMKLAYYCDVHDRRKIKETMLVFSSYNMKASNVKKEANELLSRRQQENSLDNYSDNLLKLSEDLKRLEKKENNDTENLYFDWNRKEDNTIEVVIMFKGLVHRIIRDDINAIAKYIYELCYKTNVYIYGDTYGIGMGIGDCLSELGLIVSPTKIRANIFTKDKLTDNERMLNYRGYNEKVLNKINKSY